MSWVWDRIKAGEKALIARYNVAPDSPANRRKAAIYNVVIDHSFLRVLWTNFGPVAPGVFRSNNPTQARLRRWKAKGIRAILNVRGESRDAHYLTEAAICEELGIALHGVKMKAKRPPTRDAILELIDKFRTLPRPFVIHCKSGADRAGIASAIYLLVMEGASVQRARGMLSIRYTHMKWSKTGVLDHVLDRFEARLREGAAIGFEDWIRTEYDPEEIEAAFHARRGRTERD